jgi:hypothetical protein
VYNKNIRGLKKGDAMRAPLDKEKLPEGVREWEPEPPDGSYISNLNEPEKLLTNEQWQARQAALTRLARSRRPAPTNVRVS